MTEFIIYFSIYLQFPIRYPILERMSIEANLAQHEFISAEEAEELENQEVERVYKDPFSSDYSDVAEKCRALSGLAQSGNGESRISVPREVSRKKVTNAFHDAFELIGGVPRLAVWADTHPTDFFKLYARLLPTEASQQIEHSGQVKILHAFGRGPLDE